MSTTTVAPPEAEKLFQYLLKAIAQRDFDAFLLPGTETFQTGISRQMFEGVSSQLAARLQAGHTTEFLTEIRRCEFGVFLWKLSFTDGGDQFVVRLAKTDEHKVAGFLIN